jgi:protein gp37
MIHNWYLYEQGKTMNETAISWTKYTNNPIRFRRVEDGKVGWHCEKVSQGCANCYAETLNMKWGTKDRFDVSATGRMQAFFDDKMMGKLYTIKEDTAKIFAFDMTDLFGAFIPDYLRAAAWCVILDLPQHTFQLLTKRPETELGITSNTYDCVPLVYRREREHNR